jgi:toxin ParE1/3/4
MARIELSPLANRDIIDIAATIAADRPRIAARFLARLDHLFKLFIKHPLLGERYQTAKHRTARRFPVDSYVIYYQPTDEGVLILRVLHGARDHGNLV